MTIYEKKQRLFHFTAFYVLTHGNCVCNEARKLQFKITLLRFFSNYNNFFLFFLTKYRLLLVSALLRENANCFTKVATILKVFLSAQPL